MLRAHRWRNVQNSARFLAEHLQADQRVLDVGCGPGTLTIDLARHVPDGSVTGLDVAPAAIEAAQRAERRGVENVSFRVGDVYHLDFADAHFDVVFAHQLLQHLSDPVAALREMGRVLRPGGLLAVRDADYGAFTWSPEDERLSAWRALYQRLARANRGEPNAGRYLHQWVRRAGFSLEAVSASTWVYWRADERRWWAEMWAERVRDSAFAEQCLADGLAGPAELEQIAAAFLAWAEEEDGCFLVPSTEVLARR